ncbi:Ankyrin repeat domain-containing protein 39 [Acanthosepion pharaonis]|uniref:Ankyrin repeat domain-containing protein 39 n=1 Tax=Acanthosepion pharaonis TaxID=158019 RepID=A0A812E7K6_ACAPH|nr:Ankyrin repeat domain-containing protein 39 [Sepia pharaonis]
MNSTSHTHTEGESCCSGPWLQPSVHQTLDEIDFERGIWSDACYGNTEEIIRKLNRGNRICTVNSVDSSGYTALHYASRNGHLSTCEALVMQGANVNCQTASGKSTPLHRAAYRGHRLVVKYLLSKKANPMICDADGKTALHKAAENGHTEILKELLENSPALKSITDNKGKTAFQYVSHDKQDAIEIFNSFLDDNH